MFCYQCEQTASGKGCTISGVCGKDPETAALQDLLVDVTKGISKFAHRAGVLGVRDHDVDVFTSEALFTTVTNVNFDPWRMETILLRAGHIRDRAKEMYEKACAQSGQAPETLNGSATWKPATTLDKLIEQGELVSIRKRLDSLGADLTGLQELLIYGIKGVAAYAKHAQTLGQIDPEVYAFLHEALNAVTNPNPTVDELFGLNMKCGAVTLKVLELLDRANTSTYGHPVPTQVRWGTIPWEVHPRLRP